MEDKKMEFYFSPIDLKDSELISTYSIPGTSKNFQLLIQIQRDYLDGLVKLQKELQEKYISQFEMSGEELTDEIIEQYTDVKYEKEDYRRLFYT